MAITQDEATAILHGLVALDNRLREAAHAGAPKGAEPPKPGAGLHALLETLAKQVTGLTPIGFPIADEPEPADEPEATVEAREAADGAGEAHEADPRSEGTL